LGLNAAVDQFGDAIAAAGQIEIAVDHEEAGKTGPQPKTSGGFSALPMVTPA
jgi:hypothetical protein